MATFSTGQNREFVSYENIPKHVIDAVVAAEDRRFFTHAGLDYRGVLRAAYQTGSGGNPQGGSTITQQYVKNALLVRPPNQSQSELLETKVEEAGLALRVEKVLTKEQILEKYLNIIFMGRDSYGLGAAADAYFGKGFTELTLSEAALLAGLIRAPNSGDPGRNRDEAIRRRDSVLENMFDAGWISEEQHDEARSSGLPELRKQKDRQTVSESGTAEFGTQYFTEAVRIELERIDDISPYEDGLRVYTTLDLELQQSAFEATQSNIEPFKQEAPETSVVSIDGDGLVRAMVAGQDFSASQFNLATNGITGGPGRAPGDVFKPIVFAAALEAGINPSTLYPTPKGPSIFVDDDDGSPTWEVNNRRAGSAIELDLFEGMFRSSDFVYAQLMQDLPPAKVVEVARKLGVQGELHPRKQIGLGAEPVAPLDMAVAYSTFERKGRSLPPTMIQRIENANGYVLCWYPSNGTCGDRNRKATRAVSEGTADLVSTALFVAVVDPDGVSHAASGRGQLTVGMAGSTYNDAWFVGTACGITTTVWVGHPSGSRLVKPSGEQMAGGDMPTDIWRQQAQRSLACSR